ncbi:hypothetical protein TSMEX_009374 [Taenia solium]|eukprot:TsM_001051700 transcript=TsM_001051700 gene=TsM_001051700
MRDVKGVGAKWYHGLTSIKFPPSLGVEEVNSYRLVLQTKLNKLNRHKAILKWQKLNSSTTTKICYALDGAVLQMRVAAITAQDAVTSMLEKLDEAVHESADVIARRIEHLDDMRDALASRNSLGQLICEVMLLEEAMKT